MGGKICANMKFTSASTLLQETYDTNHKKLFEKMKSLPTNENSLLRFLYKNRFDLDSH